MQVTHAVRNNVAGGALGAGVATSVLVLMGEQPKASATLTLLMVFLTLVLTLVMAREARRDP